MVSYRVSMGGRCIILSGRKRADTIALTNSLPPDIRGRSINWRGPLREWKEASEQLGGFDGCHLRLDWP